MTKNIQTVLAIAILLTAAAVMAHPPSGIKLSFDGSSRLLQVTVMHDTRKPEEHFIKSIQIRINGKDAVKQSYFKQTDPQKRTASYLFEDVKAGDEISVTGECSVFGKKTEILITQSAKQVDNTSSN
jgi:hypothetical protein